MPRPLVGLRRGRRLQGRRPRGQHERRLIGPSDAGIGQSPPGSERRGPRGVLELRRQRQGAMRQVLRSGQGGERGDRPRCLVSLLDRDLSRVPGERGDHLPRVSGHRPIRAGRGGAALRPVWRGQASPLRELSLPRQGSLHEPYRHDHGVLDVHGDRADELPRLRSQGLIPRGRLIGAWPRGKTTARWCSPDLVILRLGGLAFFPVMPLHEVLKGGSLHDHPWRRSCTNRQCSAIQVPCLAAIAPRWTEGRRRWGIARWSAHTPTMSPEPPGAGSTPRSRRGTWSCRPPG